MKILNDSINAPMRFILKDTTIALYYNSIDKSYHLCNYPYKGSKRNRNYICGGTGNYSVARGLVNHKQKCEKCFALLCVSLLEEAIKESIIKAKRKENAIKNYLTMLKKQNKKPLKDYEIG